MDQKNSNFNKDPVNGSLYEQKPRVGLGVFVFHQNKFLMGKRQGSHGAGSWSLPGGYLEFGESLAEAAAREVREETDLVIKNVRFKAVTEDHFFEEGKHHITIWMLSDYERGQATIKEPDKFIDQDWFDFNTLPTPLFLPWQNLMRSEFFASIKRAADGR